MASPETLFRVWRTRNGLSQRAAAERLGYGKRRIEAYDRGEEEPPLIVLFGMSAVEQGIPPYSFKDAA